MNIQIPNFKQAKVLIVGDVMLDRYWMGDTSRISPEAPVPVVHVREREGKPGGAGNVALNTSILGAQTTLMGMIGDDEYGSILKTLLTKAGVQSYFQVIPKAPTITKLRVLSRHQQLIRLDFEEDPVNFSAEQQLDTFTQQLANCNIVILSDYKKGTLKNAKQLIAAARKANIPVLVDPKQHSFSAYHGATLLTPNMKEFQAVVGIVSNDQELERKAREQLELNDIEALLITRSEDGMSLVTRDEPMVNIPTHAKEVFDVTGAGDTVIATLACAIASGQTWKRAMALANMAAGIAISKVGAATVSVSELHQLLHENEQSSANILTPERLKQLVLEAQASGEKVVMTNGCFDILHAGHVAYLEQAKQLGNKLIVAVNTDESVKRLKGDSRPINHCEQRMALLAGFKAVDWVVPFDEDTPQQLIAHILPDILVKGGDYTVEQIAGAKDVLGNGGEVKILCFKEGMSTSNIIEKIKGESS